MRPRIRRFGFEIEGEYSDRLEERLLETYPSWFSFKSDGSIEGCSEREADEAEEELASSIGEPDDCGGHEPMEMVSRPFNREEMGTVKKAFMTLQEAYERREFHFNETMGFHIHVSFHPLRPPELWSIEFADYFRDMLKRKYPSMWEKRSRNHYCRWVGITEEGIARLSDWNGRYAGINYWSAFKAHKTIEFRIFGSAEPIVMFAELKDTLAAIERFVRRPISKQLEIDIDELEKYREAAFTLEADTKERVLNMI
ncbi:MAG: amidoligase family protein [Patescibacteria group bacterium]|nr:amidoligase family protein [Patescibacteria group bacterium]MDE2233371.1 amidoligase family protein [Patescibacteria group bacterium]